jgi:hypothetical protein
MTQRLDPVIKEWRYFRDFLMLDLDEIGEEVERGARPPDLALKLMLQRANILVGIAQQGRPMATVLAFRRPIEVNDPADYMGC